MTFAIDADEFTAAAGALRSFVELADQELDDALDDLGADAEASVRARAARHRRTGAMESRIERIRHGADVTIHAGGRSAALIVGGTWPHELVPVRARALAIVSRVGGPVERFAGRAHHPGTTPDPFVAEALDDAIDTTDRTLERAGDQLTHELADAIS